MIRLLSLALVAGIIAWLLTHYFVPARSALTVPNNDNSQPSSMSKSADKPSSKSQVPVPAIAPDFKYTKQFELYVGIKDVLDNLLISADSTNREEIMLLGQAYCEQQLFSPEGCKEFSELLSRYLDYKLALVSIDQQTADIQIATAEIQYQLERIQALQHEHFSEAQIAALFAQDWRFDQQAIARKQIANDPDLSREQKLNLIDEHLTQLPPEQQAAFAPSIQMRKLDKIKQAYPDQQLRLVEVENEFGYEAAQRLHDTWQKQQAFEQKIAQIAAQYHALSASDDKPLRQQQTELLSSVFEGNEIRRARAILRSLDG